MAAKKKNVPDEEVMELDAPVGLPEGGEKWLKLEEIIDYYIGGDWGKDENFHDDNYQLAYCIRGAEIKKWEKEKGRSASLRKIKKQNLIKRKLQIGDILVEISGGGPEQPVGRVLLIDKETLSFNPEIPKIPTNFLRLIRLKEEIYPNYIFWYLRLFYLSGEIVKYQSGSNNLRNLKFDDYLGIRIPHTSYSIQQKIVAKIEALFAELDKSVEALKTAQQQLKVYRQAVLKAAFDGEFEENVTFFEKKILDIGRVETGTTPSKKHAEYYGGNIPFFKPTELDAGLNLFDSSEKLTESGFEQTRKLPSNSILVTCIGATIGKTALSRVPGATNQQINAIIPSNEVLPEFIYYQVISQEFQEKILSESSSTTLPIINKSKFQSLTVKICSLSSQQQIVTAIETRLTACEALGKEITQQLAQAELLRQSILKKAFSGELIS
jgi:type I restriction enzyme, S subunit